MTRRLAHVMRMPIRWRDLDAMGHVSHDRQAVGDNALPLHAAAILFFMEVRAAEATVTIG